MTLTRILTTWTMYELILFGISCVLIPALLLLSTYIMTKDKRFLKIQLFGMTAFAVILILAYTFIFEILQIDLSNISLLAPYISLLLIQINFFTMVGYYSQNRNSKKFDIDLVTREHFSDSLKLSIFTLLLTSALGIVFRGEVLVLISVVVLTTLSTVWITHFVSRKTLYD